MYQKLEEEKQDKDFEILEKASKIVEKLETLK